MSPVHWDLDEVERKSRRNKDLALVCAKIFINITSWSCQGVGGESRMYKYFFLFLFM